MLQNKRQATDYELKAAAALSNIKSKEDFSCLFDNFVNDGVDDYDISFLKNSILRYRKHIINFDVHLSHLVIKQPSLNTFINIHIAVSNYEPENDNDPKTYCEKVLDIISKFYRIAIDKIKMRSRKRELVKCRQIFYLLCKGKMSLRELGLFVGVQDHSTVIHAMNSIENLLAYDEDLQSEVSQIKSYLV